MDNYQEELKVDRERRLSQFDVQWSDIQNAINDMAT